MLEIILRGVGFKPAGLNLEVEKLERETLKTESKNGGLIVVTHSIRGRTKGGVTNASHGAGNQETKMSNLARKLQKLESRTRGTIVVRF